MTHYLEFEKPLAEIEGKAEELRALARQNEEKISWQKKTQKRGAV